MAMDKLALVGLKGLENRAPSELSGGQQQRVAVARALVLEPQVLLFDEPLSNLDAKLRRRVREEIRELQISLGLTVAYVTHDQEEALAVSDRIIVMSNARIAQIGTPRELYDAPANRFVADFMGDANLIPVEVGKAEGEFTSVRVGQCSLKLAHRGIAAGKAFIAVRPHRLSIRKQSAGNGDLEGHVSKVAYVGDYMEYGVKITTPELELFAIVPASAHAIARGDRVVIKFDASSAVLIPADPP
jgi:iron(III) transport system ATP-binding protein